MHVPIRRSLLIALLASRFAFAQPAIHLKTRQIETGPSGAPTEASSPRQFGRGHLLIQFQQPPSPETVAELERRGVRFERYPGLPQDDRGVWTTPNARAKVAWFKDPDGNTLSLTESA